MTAHNTDRRTLDWDWYPGSIPLNVEVDPTAYIETTFSFHCYRSKATTGVKMGRGASTYLGTMFDSGPRGVVSIGEFALVHGARIICDSEIEIGHHALISWNVVLMDTYRAPRDRHARRDLLRRSSLVHLLDHDAPPRPVRIGPNVWLGFDVCVLPGVTIGEGSIVGARSVVAEDVPAYCIAAGNPARIVRWIEPRESASPRDGELR